MPHEHDQNTTSEEVIQYFEEFRNTWAQTRQECMEELDLAEKEFLEASTALWYSEKIRTGNGSRKPR